MSICRLSQSLRFDPETQLYVINDLRIFIRIPHNETMHQPEISTSCLNAIGIDSNAITSPSPVPESPVHRRVVEQQCCWTDATHSTGNCTGSSNHVFTWSHSPMFRLSQCTLQVMMLMVVVVNGQKRLSSCHDATNDVILIHV